MKERPGLMEGGRYRSCTDVYTAYYIRVTAGLQKPREHGSTAPTIKARTTGEKKKNEKKKKSLEKK